MGKRKVIFAAMSKRNFYLREHIVKFILERGLTPSCAFMMYSYFLLDTVDRLELIKANNDLIRRSDELWVFGEISDGVGQEIRLARRLKLPVHYFQIGEKSVEFVEIEESAVEREGWMARKSQAIVTLPRRSRTTWQARRESNPQ